MTTPHNVPAGYQLVPVQPPRKRGLRPFTWVILALNALALVLVIVGANTKPDTKNCGTLSVEACRAAGQIGAGIGVIALILMWAVLDVILLVIWLVTRPRQR